MKYQLSQIRTLFSKFFSRALDYVEIIGNKLPHPATLFALLALLVVLLSWIGHTLNLQAEHPVDGTIIKARNLLSSDGIRWIYTHLIENFLRFPPLGYVLVVMIGIGVAEGSGLFTTLIRSMVLSAPPRYITMAIVFAGILSHLASEAGYVILIPLGAMIFHALGRHPMAGLAAAFCGVSGGFGANFFIGSIDPILSGISESAAQMIIPGIEVNPAVNYYFMVASSFLIIIIGTWVTERIVEPRLGPYEGTAEKLAIEQLKPIEKKGLRWAGIALLIFLALISLTVIPENGILRDPVTKSVLHSPFFKGIIIAILLMFFIPGLVYGIIVGTIRSDKDVAKYLGQAMSGMGGYIVLVFFAAQFVYFFNYSNLGIIFAIKGAKSLQSAGMTGVSLIVGFVLLSAFINMFMGSASAKWAIMAPVFIPMLMLIDPPYHPAITQAAFRIGDSVTNIITPMMSYFALIVTFAQKYDHRFGIGTIISTMLPYTVMLTIGWVLLLVIWMLIGIPLGPDGPVFLQP